MKDHELKDLIANYRQGLITAKELVAFLEAKLYNKSNENKSSKN